MARGRMLNKTVTLSMKFQQLPDDTCRLLATWTISHLDKNGVFYGEAVTVRSLIFPLREDVSTAQVAGYIQAMEQVGLIRLFVSGGRTWQAWEGFTDNQAGLRAERETSDFPMPDFSRNESGMNPAECPQKRIEEKRNEVEGEEKANPREHPPPKLIPQNEAIRIYTSMTGRIANDDQRRAIAAIVTDIPLWERTITAWRVSGWKDTNIQGMLDVYKKGGVTSKAIPVAGYPRRSSARTQVQDATDAERARANEAARQRIAERAARREVTR